MSIRNKQNWIKDILSKSGTEITAVNEDKSEGWFLARIIVFIRFEFFFRFLLTTQNFCFDNKIRDFHSTSQMSK